MYVHHNFAVYLHLYFIFGQVAFITGDIGKLFFASLFGCNQKCLQDLTGSSQPNHFEQKNGHLKKINQTPPQFCQKYS